MFLPKTIIFNNNLTFQLIDRRKAPVDGRSPAAVDRSAVEWFHATGSLVSPPRCFNLETLKRGFAA